MNKEKQIEVLEDLKSYVNEEWDEYEYAECSTRCSNSFNQIV